MAADGPQQKTAENTHQTVEILRRIGEVFTAASRNAGNTLRDEVVGNV